MEIKRWQDEFAAEFFARVEMEPEAKIPLTLEVIKILEELKEKAMLSAPSSEAAIGYTKIGQLEVTNMGEAFFADENNESNVVDLASHNVHFRNLETGFYDVCVGPRLKQVKFLSVNKMVERLRSVGESQDYPEKILAEALRAKGIEQTKEN